MHSLKAFIIVAGGLVMAFAANALQVQGGVTGPATGGKPVIPVPNATTERGGTITQIDLKKRQMVVDGVVYALSPTTKISHAAGKQSRPGDDLRVGHQVRFTTRRSASASAESVSQIWVTGQDRRGLTK